MGSSTGTAKLWWWEPRWSYRPRFKAELGVLANHRVWLRICLWAAVIVTPLALALRYAVPDLEFNWFKGIALSFLAFLLYAGVAFSLYWWMPPIVRLSDKGVSRQQGQHVHWRLRRDIRRIVVDTTALAHPVLRVETTGKPLEAGVSAKVGPEELLKFLRQAFPELLVEERG